MKFTLNTPNKALTTDVQVVFCTNDGKKDAKATLLDRTLQKQWKTSLEAISSVFSGQLGSSYFMRSTDGTPSTLFLGLGTSKSSTEALRHASAALYSNLKAQKASSVTLPLKGLKSESALVGLVEGLILSSYSFTTFKKEDPKAYALKKVDLLVDKTSAKLSGMVSDAEKIAAATNFSRWLGDCPGNFMHPTQLAKEAGDMSKLHKNFKVTSWDKKRITKEKMDSLLGVSLGSDQEPRFIIMEYKNGPARQKPMCLVGKGLTFDSGGISLKPGGGMEEMKFDMCGGAAVIGAMKAIVSMGLKVNVTAYVPASENMPGPSANKPGDIRKARNGKSIEINNTDAEGRLILADALCYASEQKPGVILDAATLTGAMVVALGNIHTGFYTRDNKLRKSVEKAADQSGEKVWPMPLVDDHSKDMTGHYADLTNLAPSRGAGSATAAAFLENFVEKDIPWAHFDVAGTAWHAGNRLPYAPRKGASGSMVRTFVEFAKNYK